MGQGMALALAGAGIGIAGALGLSPLFAGMLYAVKSNDPATFVVVTVVLTEVALVVSCPHFPRS